jgi:hypothetical protein
MGCATDPKPPYVPPLPPPDFHVIDSDRINVAMAYISYIGETLRRVPNELQIIRERIKLIIPNIPVLTLDGKADWKVAWGPAVYTFADAEFQDNGMFVAQQISNPTNYIVAIRGTNFQAVLDWVFEDFNVLKMHDWKGDGNSAKISESTYEGVTILKHRLESNYYLTLNELNRDPAISLYEFLKSAAKDQKITVSFTGHSLGGALAPTLALMFKQEQGKPGGWDSQNNATVTSTSFAGATAGNKEFAKYSNQMMGSDMRRINNFHDVVPYAWNKNTMEQIEYLYQPEGLKLDFWLKLAVDEAIYFTKDKHYTQIEQSLPFNFPVTINKKIGKTFSKQMSYQHTHSYPIYILGAKDGLDLINAVNALK